MSSSSDTGRRLSQTTPETEGGKPEARRGSRYEIYGTATRPFGESYRRSLQQQQEQDSSVDTDSVEETMGCNTSRTQVADAGETARGTFARKEKKSAAAKLEATVDPRDSKHAAEAAHAAEKNDNIQGSKDVKNKLSDFEIIYGEHEHPTIGCSTLEIYSEVKKTEKTLDKDESQHIKQTPREKLMQQIRDRKDETNDVGYSTVAAVNTIIKEEEVTNRTNEGGNSLENKSKMESVTKNTAISAPVSFVEEEYSYEPENQESSSKLVVRSRSLANLDQNQYNSSLCCTLQRPNKLKITTKPDGTIRYGLRSGASEADILGNDFDDSPLQGSEIKNNYVSSIKSAFDAAIESEKECVQGKAKAFDGLRQYFQDNKHGLQELLTNNNVVIIEPFRPSPPRSPSDKSDTSQRTCRITGATVKSPGGGEQARLPAASNTLPRSTKAARQGFYHPIKKNKELIDAELPDPDKVRTVREVFEKVFRTKSSSQAPQKKSSAKSFFNTITSKMRIGPETKVDGKQSAADRKRQGRFPVDQVTRDRCSLQRRWTDSGSLSSGVSSDFSCDQDWEYHGSTGGSNNEILEEYSSDDDELEYIYPYDDDERHPVSTEVLQKIRACGTTVTYYGGKVIARSHGQCRSPMTMTIMDEIRQCCTSECRKMFESDSEDSGLGVKFRLVKSNSCGSRLEIAGTEEDGKTTQHESIAEEPTEIKESEEENHTSLEEEEDKAEADQYKAGVPVMTWAELKLKEARKQWHCAPEAVRLPTQDMEFETFEVLDDSQPLKADKTETGRG